MEKYFGEKQERFSFRKLSVGLVSATISSLFFMSVLASSSVAAQETKGVHYKYVTESELSSEEKKQLVYDIPTYVENDDETYYLVYKLNSQNQLGELPNTGSKNEMQALVAGASLAALGILVFAVSKKKIKNKTVLHLVLVAGIGNGILVSAHALENNLLLNYNTDYELTSGEKLPLPKDISGYTYIGYIKEGKTTSDSKVSNQEKSVATPIDQQKVDYTIAPNFIENPSKIQVINGQYEAVPEFRDGQVGTVATESAETKADTLSSDMNSEVESHSTPPTVDSSQNGENLGKQKEDATPVEKPKEVEETNKPEKDESKDETSTKPENSGNAITEENGQTVPTESNQGDTNKVGESNKPENNDSKNETSEKTVEEVPVNPTEGSTEGTSNQEAENPVQPAEESTTNSGEDATPKSGEKSGETKEESTDASEVPSATPVEKPKEQELEKTVEEVPVKPNEGTTEGTSTQGAENPVQSAEESTTNSEKVSPDTSNENTGEVSSNPSNSTTSVEETNKPEKDELNVELGKESGTKKSDKYQNADQAKQAAYDKALAAAKAVAAKEGASQAEIDQAKNDLVAAAAALNGQGTDKEPLRTAATTDATATKETAKYQNATADKKKAYDAALEAAQKVLAKAGATQAEVNAAKQAVENAKGQLDGVASDKSALKAELGKESGTKKSDKYQNADQAKQAAYDKALAAAKAVAAKEGASQAEIDQAKNDLVAAAAALNGQPTSKDESKDETSKVGESNKPENNDSKNETSEKTVEEGPVKPNEGTTKGTSTQGAENPVQSAGENTGEVSNKPSDSKPPVEETNKPENSGNATTEENGQTEPDQPKGNSTEDVSSESNTANSNGNEEIKQETEVEPDKKVEVQEKTIELRSVSDVELYSYEGNQSKQHTSLDKVPDNKSAYFIKVKSAKYKDVMLPVSNIEDTTKDGKAVYKITASLEHLKQSVDNQYQDNFTYYLPKVVQNDGPIYTSFKKLVTDMNSRPNGTFTLGATMNAREVELDENQESYVTKNFTGTLIGSHQGKHYAIYNLKKPLFNTLNRATVKDLTLKDVNISGKNHVASVAKEATNSSTLDNVHANGIIAGELGIGGLIQKVENSTVSNSSFTGRITNTFVTTSQYAIGGLVGQLTGTNARVDHSIATVTISSNGEHSNQTIGGIAGIVENNATVENSYAEGEINNAKPFARVGGVAGSLWTNGSSTKDNSGILQNVLSDMNITNGNAISGYHFNGIKETNVYSNKENKVVNVQQVDDEVMSVDSTVERGTEIEKTAVQAKKEKITTKHTVTVEDFTNSAKQDVDYTKAAHYQETRKVAYKNIEKLLPFYNRDTIVKYGNLVSVNDKLFKKELLSVVPMKNDEVVSDITSDKHSINHLLLHYKDGTSEKVSLTYHSDFANLAEYTIGTTGLVYTPNAFLKDYSSIIDRVKNDLNTVQYNPSALKNLLGISDNVKLTELYLDEQFAKTKEHLTETLKKLLSADAAVTGNNSAIDNYMVDKIKRNKEALMLGLTYLERWYDFKFDKASAKDLLMFHMDFFGKGNTSPLDTIIELGKSGYNNLLAKNNVVTYNALLTNNYGTKDLFSALEGYRKAFAPTQTNNDWFKSQTKAYIVEEKSNIPEVRANQEKAGSKYSIGVYDRITSDSWKYRNMVLPLLTLPEKSVFVISTISSLGFGAYDRYRNSDYKAGDKLNKFVEKSAHETAERQRDHYDYWYRILDEKGREKLYRNILLYDAYKFGNDNTEGKAKKVADFDDPNPAMKHFFGPVGNKVGHNEHGAYATGDAVYYMGYRMLDKDGAITYTHEMTHDSDQDIYLGGYGRRSGLGPEFFAKGLLQAPDHPNDATITINSILKHSKSDSTEGQRLQILDPTTRFKNATDLQNYVHNMFDVVYMLEYLEGQSIISQLSATEKMAALRKIENKYVKDPADGNSVYATNVVKDLTVEDANKLTSFESLITNNILSAREYKSKEYERNGYFTIKLFAPIYAALSSDNGTPGDLMGRRIAYELLAAKGFKDGMVPYISNQYEEEAKQNGKKITIYGKERGLVTDDLVLKKVFNGQYKTWTEFKKAMYKERQDKFGQLNTVSFKDPSIPWYIRGTKTINSVTELQELMNQAVRKDAKNNYYHWNNYNPDIDSEVHKLKKAIFKAYLDQTDDFRSSIFENKK
ncbi:YSIRK-type signal peptide-containing protein [Streptococcus pseudopneumoniae]|uniref:YSIRK-type signal peptide-containing protein n=1 Tax=Streptococcus pseudopneumoniae TaxID=257758 RepID=A0ABX9PB71_9STRE|nr:ZmpA/ZmpB/ZmpC family metallo-endopeptidase [Streptococcus pseudopneumoniae]MBW8145811.1 FIVAR domain-containing protein [Streptococcus pseudopneumoniae]RJY14623.1 YSIRK-type signal peptide-containing protein [Streptococcus pseudopneumoniae]